MDYLKGHVMKLFVICVSLSIMLSVCAGCANEIISIQPAVITEPVGTDADDPAIWVNSSNPAESLILGTDKCKKTGCGSLYVFGLDGKVRQTIENLTGPNNVDVEYGFKLGGTKTDIAVLTERGTRSIRIYRIDAKDGKLTDVSGETDIFQGETGESAEPMGIGLYKRSKDAAVFAVVSRKSGPADGYLHQYLLKDDGKGKVDVVKVRAFGKYSGAKEIESVSIDDALEFVYCGDETRGIRKYHADPDHPDADKELAFFAQSGYTGDHEGIGVYNLGKQDGYVICTDQNKGHSRYYIYPRNGSGADPNKHEPAIKIIAGADETDGLDATSANLGEAFPNGLVVVMNSKGRNFHLYRWDDIANTGEPKLKTK